MQIVFLAIDCVQVVAEDSDGEVRVLAEASVAHEMGVLKLDDPGNFLGLGSLAGIALA